MQRDNWPVTEASTRPAGKPDECFYCGVKIGGEHEAGCVLRRRTVVVTCAIEMLLVFPEHWDAERIEHYRNESNWCAGNIVTELQRILERRDKAYGSECLCGKVKTTYLREATEEDERYWCLKVQDLKDDE